MNHVISKSPVLPVKAGGGRTISFSSHKSRAPHVTNWRVLRTPLLLESSERCSDAEVGNSHLA